MKVYVLFNGIGYWNKSNGGFDKEITLENLSDDEETSLYRAKMLNCDVWCFRMDLCRVGTVTKESL